MNNNLKNSKKNFLFSIISQVITIAIGIVIPRLTILGYGSEVNGLLNSVVQFIAYLVLFEAGIQAVATQALYKAISMDNKDGISSIISAVNHSYKKVGLFYFLGLLFLSFIFPLISRSGIPYWTVVAVVFFSGFGNVISFLYQGKYRILMMAEGKGYIITNINLIISVLNHIVKIIMLILGINVALIIFCSFLVSLIQTVYIYFYVKKKYRWINLNASPDYSSLKQSNSAIIHQISGLIFYNTDVLLLTVFCGLETVSIYSVYKLVIEYIKNLLVLPMNSCCFALGQLYNKDIKRFNTEINAVEVINSLLACSVFSVTSFLFLPFIKLYTSGASSNYISFTISILFVVSALLEIIRLPMLNTINFAGHFKETISRTIAESVINLTLSLILVNYLGIQGVLIGTVGALLYRTIDVWAYSNKLILKRSGFRTFFINCANIFLGVIIYFILRLLNITINSYFDFIIVGAISIVLVFTVFLLYNSLLFKNEFKIICGFIRSNVKKRSLEKND